MKSLCRLMWAPRRTWLDLAVALLFFGFILFVIVARMVTP